MRLGLIALVSKAMSKKRGGRLPDKDGLPSSDGSSGKLGWADWLTAMICGCGLFVVLMVSLVQGFSESPAYYLYKFETLRIAENTVFEPLNITKLHPLNSSQLTPLAEGIASYLGHGQRDFTAMIPIVGQQKMVDAFGEREKLHMDDVRNLFDRFDQLKRVLGGFCILMLALTMLRYGRWHGQRYARLLSLTIRVMAHFTGGFVLLLGVMQFVDFNKYFIMFHQMFFTNDLWQLDPANSLLINLLPESFFIGFVMDTLIAMVICNAILVVFATAIKKKWGGTC